MSETRLTEAEFARLDRSEPRKGDCNATDGYAVCTMAPGHGPVHWDRRIEHEWSDDDG